MEDPLVQQLTLQCIFWCVSKYGIAKSCRWFVVPLGCLAWGCCFVCFMAKATERFCNEPVATALPVGKEKGVAALPVGRQGQGRLRRDLPLDRGIPRVHPELPARPGRGSNPEKGPEAHPVRGGLFKPETEMSLFLALHFMPSKVQLHSKGIE